MPPFGTLITFLITLVVVIGLTIFILRQLVIDAIIKNIILAVEGLIFLFWFLRIMSLV